MTYPAYDKPISIENFLGFYKTLPPLLDNDISDLERISALNVSDYSEADVREEIITPILWVLGYRKETYFSMGREKALKVGNRSKFVDYSVTLFSENFWLIEAKKPSARRKFGHREILQSLQYAAHPEINAALMVLCDGRIIEVFDREHSLEEPVARCEISNIVANIDRLRVLLSPWQNWFFQKRRLVRIADKVLANEYSLERGKELIDLVQSRYEHSRMKILDNSRERISFERDNGAWLNHLRRAEPRELIDVWFFAGRHTFSVYRAMAENLIERVREHRTQFIFNLLPEQPRDANAEFWGATLFFLMALEKEVAAIGGLPSWLGQNVKGQTPLEPAIQKLISLCLTGFEADRGRQAMMLLAFACRRLAKLLVNLQPSLRDMGRFGHLLNRFESDELSWRQTVSSEEGEVLRFLGRCEMLLPAKALKQFSSERESGFKTETAITYLKDILGAERSLLKLNPRYGELRKELSLWEVHPTEHMQVSYDYLGHLALCMISAFPKWRQHVLAKHRPEIEEQAAQGMFMAKQLLGEENSEGMSPDRKLMAQRFFLGDEALMQDLLTGYGIAPKGTSV